MKHFLSLKDILQLQGTAVKDDYIPQKTME